MTLRELFVINGEWDNDTALIIIRDKTVKQMLAGEAIESYADTPIIWFKHKVVVLE